MDQYGIRPSRALGQNFVTDQNTVRKIAHLAKIGPGDHVIEIGGGLGSLTLALAETGASITTVEIDKYVLPALRLVAEPQGVRVVEADVMSIDWNDLLGDSDSWVLAGNLPYNIATPIVTNILDFVPKIGRMVLMAQREVVDRMVAGVGDAAYGAVSVKVAYWARAKFLGAVPPTVFVPRPKIDSALLSIERRADPVFSEADVDREIFFELVRAGFAHRRKTLRNALEGLVSPATFDQAGISPSARAEELDVQAWGRLAICKMAP